MTLGISYAFNGRLVVIGDLLISGDERERDVSIPSVGNVTSVFPKGAGFSIVGLTQKVIVICPNMVIAWAGHEVAAAMVIRELRELAASGLTPDKLAFFFEQLPDDVKGLDLQLTGFYVHEERGYLIDFSEVKVDSGKFSDLRLIGSGAEVFEKMLGNYQWVHGSSRGVDVERGEFLSTSMMFAGMLLELELRSRPTSLHCYFGGGYEVVLGEAGAFRKLDDVTHVYWKILVTEDGVGITQPFYIQKQFYRGAALMIMPIRFAQNKADRAQGFGGEVYVVQEPGQLLDVQEISEADLPSYNSCNTCHYFIQDETARVFTRFQYREDTKDNDLIVVESDAGYQLNIRKSFFESVTTTIWNDPKW